jgi:hypothetical protein
MVSQANGVAVVRGRTMIYSEKSCEAKSKVIAFGLELLRFQQQDTDG